MAFEEAKTKKETGKIDTLTSEINRLKLREQYLKDRNEKILASIQKKGWPLVISLIKWSAVAVGAGLIFPPAGLTVVGLYFGNLAIKGMNIAFNKNVSIKGKINKRKRYEQQLEKINQDVKKRVLGVEKGLEEENQITDSDELQEPTNNQDNLVNLDEKDFNNQPINTSVEEPVILDNSQSVNSSKEQKDRIVNIGETIEQLKKSKEDLLNNSINGEYGFKKEQIIQDKPINDQSLDKYKTDGMTDQQIIDARNNIGEYKRR